MRSITSLAAVAVLLLAATGCGGGSTGGTAHGAKDPTTGKTITDSKGQAVSVEAANKFKTAMDSMVQHDKAGDWSEATCSSTAQLFLDAADEQGDTTFAEAIYNAGLAYQRCKKDSEAKKHFTQALQKNPKFHPARVQVALYNLAESGERNLDAAISEMRQAAVVDAQYKNVEALVHLALLYMKRGNQVADNDGPNDFQRAKRYIQSALAVDDAFMPAFNQLAIYYLETAKQKAGRKTGKAVATNVSKQKKVDTQALELAALVCSQAIRKNPNYAPIHNTAGMIQVELANLNGAVQEFNLARRLDPTFYEAQMNYAAVNLQFRGFQQADEAYRAALKMRPNDYDAHLGLALALRGQIDDANFDSMVAAASAELEAAKKVAPERAETYYNEAILTQEYKAKSGGKGAEGALMSAKGLFGQFIQKAGASTEFADAVKRSKERMSEIDQIIAFNKQTEAERKAAEADMKTKEAEQEAAAGSEGEGGEATTPAPAPAQ
ncbi:tetratricopeptide repeat protein [Sorangium sp. So ce302]|uniref:tetratricopeptide repeat protein n=1 Tax=unclassified Sorangium TaxID=2621164 RepID=UPI003F616DF6